MEIEVFVCNNDPGSNGVLNGTFIPDSVRIGDTITNKDVDFNARYIITSLVYTTRNSTAGNYTCIIAASKNLPT